MAKEHSFQITFLNNKTESLGINYLIENCTGFFKISLEMKKQILDLLKLSHTFHRAFDLIFIPRFIGQIITTDVIEAHIDEIILVELKCTRKYLPNNPKGFFFGATENEFKFGELLGDRFRFCFVSLHEDSPSHAMLTIAELASIVRHKRIQYQINL